MAEAKGREAGDATLGEERCQACGARLWEMGVQDIAVGNVNAVARGLTPWGEGLAPERMPLELFVCSDCRRVEFRVPREA